MTKLMLELDTETGLIKAVSKPGAAYKVAKKTVHYDDSSPVTIFTCPAGSIIYGVMINVTTAWVGTGPSLTIGDTSDYDGFLKTTAVTTTGWKGGDPVNDWGVYLYDANTNYKPRCYIAATDIIAAIVGVGLTAGEADVYIIYIDLSAA